jgi:hypothetical protein
VEPRGNALIQALAGLCCGYDKLVKRRFAALAHAEIVAAVANGAFGASNVLKPAG